MTPSRKCAIKPSQLGVLDSGCGAGSFRRALKPGGQLAPREAVASAGELWWCEMAEIGRRPVVVLWRDAATPRLRPALVAPCTTTIRRLPTEVVLQPGSDPVPRRSVVNLDSVESLSVAVLVSRLGRLADTRMRDICAALDVAVDCSR
jgi:mRNA interferase MazF